MRRQDCVSDWSRDGSAIGAACFVNAAYGHDRDIALTRSRNVPPLDCASALPSALRMASFDEAPIA